MRHPLRRSFGPDGHRLLLIGEYRNSDILPIVLVAASKLDLTLSHQNQSNAPDSFLPTIWEEIQRAELIVAAVSERSSAFFELGLALALGKRILVVTDSKDRLPSVLRSMVIVEFSGVSREERIRRIVGVARNMLIEPAVEMDLVPIDGWENSPVRDRGLVIDVAADRAVVRVSSGRTGVLRPTDVTWTRIVKDLRKHIKVGQHLDGMFWVDTAGQGRFSSTALEENPWIEIVRQFRVGQPFQGRVYSWLPGTGLFVTLANGINGLVPRSTLPANVSFAPGEEVLAIPVRIDEAARLAELRLEGRLSATRDLPGKPEPTTTSFSPGDTVTGEVVHVSSRADYLLIRLDDDHTGILHTSNMTPALRSAIMKDEVSIGDPLFVRILEFDGVRNRIILADDPRSLPPTPSLPTRLTRRVSGEDAIREVAFLDLIAKLEPYLFTAERRPSRQWPLGRATPFPIEQVERIDHWYTKHRDEISAVWNVRNRLVHGRVASDDEISDTAKIAQRLLTIISEQM